MQIDQRVDSAFIQAKGQAQRTEYRPTFLLVIAVCKRAFVNAIDFLLKTKRKRSQTHVCNN